MTARRDGYWLTRRVLQVALLFLLLVSVVALLITDEKVGFRICALVLAVMLALSLAAERYTKWIDFKHEDLAPADYRRKRNQEAIQVLLFVCVVIFGILLIASPRLDLEWLGLLLLAIEAARLLYRERRQRVGAASTRDG